MCQLLLTTHRVGQSDVERVGNVIGDVKDKRRTPLQGMNYLSAVRLAFNLPFVHEIDKQLLVKAWKKMRHRLCVHKNGAGSKVLERLKDRASSVPFLLHKDSELRDIDLSRLEGGVKAPPPPRQQQQLQQRHQPGGGRGSTTSESVDVDEDEDEDEIVGVGGWVGGLGDDGLPLDAGGCTDYLGYPERRMALSSGGAAETQGHEAEVVEVEAEDAVAAPEGPRDQAIELDSDSDDDAAPEGSRRHAIEFDDDSGDDSDGSDCDAGVNWTREWLSIRFSGAGAAALDASDTERVLEAQHAPEYSTVASLRSGAARSKVLVLGMHMATTKPLVWLCDEIVIAFCFLMMWDTCKCDEDSGRRRSHIFTYSFMWAILGDGSSDDEFGDYLFRSRFGRKVPGGNIFELEWVFVPVCYRSHWVLVVANMQLKYLTCLNSLVGNNKTMIGAFLHYLEDEAGRLNISFDSSEWNASSTLTTADSRAQNRRTVTTAACTC